MKHSRASSFRLITAKERIALAILIIALLVLLQLHVSRPIASVEVKFTDSSARGLAIMPASAESPPYAQGYYYAQGSYPTGGGYYYAQGYYYESQVLVLPVTVESVIETPSPVYVGFAATGPNGAFTATGKLQVRPALLLSGQPAYVFWSISNITGCTITGSNGDSWRGASSGTTGTTSSPILGQTTFTLACAGIPGAAVNSINESVTVNVAPTYQEQ